MTAVISQYHSVKLNVSDNVMDGMHLLTYLIRRCIFQFSIAGL